MNQLERRRQLLALCGELGPEDGADPRDFFRHREVRTGDRKLQQLCGQVAHALSLALSGAEHEALREGAVIAVAPAPDARRLRVVVEGVDPDATGAALNSARAWLRSQVAASIHRKQCPILVFEVRPRTEAAP